MIRKNSLKYQFKKQLIISIGLLIIIFSFMLDRMFFSGIGASMHRSMLSMASHYALQVESNPDFQLPHDGEYSVFVGRKTIPKQIEAMFDVDLMKDYSFAVNDGGNLIKMFKPDHLSFLVIHPLKNSTEKLYLFYNEHFKTNTPPLLHSGKVFLPPPWGQRRFPTPWDKQGFPPPPSEPDFPLSWDKQGFPPLLSEPGFPLSWDKPKVGMPEKISLINVPTSIAFILLLAMLLVYWVIRRLISTVLTPLNELAVMAKKLDGNSPELSFKIMKNNTEIGAVAKILHQTMLRVQQYHQREKQFLQNASHELRTPIAVVSSALDIIELRASQGNVNILDQHANIRRANKNMAELTAALLLLSRKQSNNVYLQKVNLKQLSATLIEEHKYLLKGKNVGVELINIDSSEFELPIALCRIVLSNLIRNAFEHTLAGTVCVQVSNLSVLITNTSTGLSTDSQRFSANKVDDRQGFGIGLDIVRKIVKQQKWQLNLSSDLQNGNKVIICFDKSALTENS